MTRVCSVALRTARSRWPLDERLLRPSSTRPAVSATASRYAFTDGMSVVLLAAAAVAFLTAVLELAVMPGRREREAQLMALDELERAAPARAEVQAAG